MSRPMYPPRGTLVRLVRCNDPHTRLEPGTTGTVILVDAVGTVHVRWDNGSRLGLCFDDGDRYEVLGIGPLPEENS